MANSVLDDHISKHKPVTLSCPQSNCH